MPFRANYEDAVNEYLGQNGQEGIVRQLNVRLADVIAFMAANTISANVIHQTWEQLVKVRNRLTAISALTGFQAHIRNRMGDQTYDATGELNGILSAIATLQTYLTGTIQSTADTFVASGVNTQQFTPAQTATLRGHLQGVVNAVRGV
jgi:hypothetical protein